MNIIILYTCIRTLTSNHKNSPSPCCSTYTFDLYDPQLSGFRLAPRVEKLYYYYYVPLTIGCRYSTHVCRGLITINSIYILLFRNALRLRKMCYRFVRNAVYPTTRFRRVSTTIYKYNTYNNIYWEIRRDVIRCLIDILSVVRSFAFYVNSFWPQTRVAFFYPLFILPDFVLEILPPSVGRSVGRF